MPAQLECRAKGSELAGNRTHICFGPGISGDDAGALANEQPRSCKAALAEPENDDVLTPQTAHRLPQLERSETHDREHDRDDPEANYDLRLRPTDLLVVVVDRRHSE